MTPEEKALLESMGDMNHDRTVSAEEAFNALNNDDKTQLIDGFFKFNFSQMLGETLPSRLEMERKTRGDDADKSGEVYAGVRADIQKEANDMLAIAHAMLKNGHASEYRDGKAMQLLKSIDIPADIAAVAKIVEALPEPVFELPEIAPSAPKKPAPSWDPFSKEPRIYDI